MSCYTPDCCMEEQSIFDIEQEHRSLDEQIIRCERALHLRIDDPQLQSHIKELKKRKLALRDKIEDIRLASGISC